MKNYVLINREIGNAYIEAEDADGKLWNIPIDEFNSDYQRYLAQQDAETL